MCVFLPVSKQCKYFENLLMIIIIILVSFRIKWMQIVGNIFIKLDLILMVVVKLERMNIMSKLIFFLFF